MLNLSFGFLAHFDRDRFFSALRDLQGDYTQEGQDHEDREDIDYAATAYDRADKVSDVLQCLTDGDIETAEGFFGELDITLADFRTQYMGE